MTVITGKIYEYEAEEATLTGLLSVPTSLRNRMNGFASDGALKMVYRDNNGNDRYWTPDSSPLLRTDDVEIRVGEIQLKLSFDATNFTTFYTDSSGNLTIDPTGTTLTLNAATVTAPSLRVSGQTASRLCAFNGTKDIIATSLASWVTGTANRITVTDDGDGTLTLNLPQDIHNAATPTFTGLTTTGNVTLGDASTNIHLVNGTLQLANGRAKFKGTGTDGLTGGGMEIQYNSGEATMLSYNRTSTSFEPLNITGSTVNIGVCGLVNSLKIDAAGNTTIGSSASNEHTVNGGLTVTGDVKTVGLTQYGSTSTVTGWNGLADRVINYKLVGKTLHVWFVLNGTADSAAPGSFTLPYNIKSESANPPGYVFITKYDPPLFEEENEVWVCERDNTTANKINIRSKNAPVHGAQYTARGYFCYEIQ